MLTMLLVANCKLIMTAYNLTRLGHINWVIQPRGISINQYLTVKPLMLLIFTIIAVWWSSGWMLMLMMTKIADVVHPNMSKSAHQNRASFSKTGPTCRSRFVVTRHNLHFVILVWWWWWWWWLWRRCIIFSLQDPFSEMFPLTIFSSPSSGRVSLGAEIKALLSNRETLNKNTLSCYSDVVIEHKGRPGLRSPHIIAQVSVGRS